jgi:AraC-like DNA-binding protein
MRKTMAMRSPPDVFPRMKDYFVYLPGGAAPSIWGCVATSAGFTRILPNTPYPPQRHPVDHHFDWSEGRVLQSYQIILISSGTGTFESEATAGTQIVEPGTILLLFPGVWHRYRPTPATGWVEHWIECIGPAFDEAVRSGLIEPEHGLLKTGNTSDLSDCFERCHGLARRDALSNQDLLSTLGLHMLAHLGNMRRGERGFEKSIDEVVQRAHSLIALRCQAPFNLAALASELGVGYSNLRHHFTARIGISPRQHYLNTRIRKAQDLLTNTTKSVKEIAEILGFDSPSHFSKQFQALCKTSPRAWRSVQSS